MIGKVGSSTSIKGTVDYLENSGDRVDWKATQHLASADKEFVIQEMQAASETSRSDQPVYHYSISWDEADNPSREQMEAVARQTLKDLGLSEHQALIVAHNDHDYAHLHVVVNRVHPESGRAWDRWMDYKKLEQSLRPLERRCGWKEVPGHHYRLEGQQKPALGQSLNRMEVARINQGEYPFFAIVQELASEDFRSAETWMELHQRLAAHGLTIQRGSRGTGGKITDGKNVANLSKIHRDFSMNKLTQRLGPFKSMEQLQASKGLTKSQKTFAQFEQALRMGKPSQYSLQKGVNKTLKTLGTAKKVHSTLNSFLAVATPQNPAFKIATRMGRSIIKQLKQQHRSIERGR